MDSSSSIQDMLVSRSSQADRQHLESEMESLCNDDVDRMEAFDQHAETSQQQQAQLEILW